MADMKDIETKVDVAVPLEIRGKETSIVTKTISITSAGAYCNTDTPLPLLSKVALTLLVPDNNKKKGERKIDCKGTVVRTHPVLAEGKPQSYDVAIYFDELSDCDRQAISQYIAGHLGKNR